MDIQIIAIYCLCDDMLKMLKAMHHRKDPQRQMSDAEVMTTAIVAALFFGGNLEASRRFLQTHGYMPRMVSKSRFHRRLQRIKSLFLTLFNLLGEHWKALNADSIYIIDIFPIPVCDNASGSFIDGVRSSEVCIHDLELERRPYIALRIGVKPDAINIGGMNLFGKHFGNYAQDLVLKITYTSTSKTSEKIDTTNA